MEFHYENRSIIYINYRSLDNERNFTALLTRLSNFFQCDSRSEATTSLSGDL